ncbi:MAG: T9SS C-terminal target domain-containing protein [Calditrichaeota bacterium]|nr:MAG: T9SS C-terminal target domain-containing protein [Calditrichota bacterium]
MKLCCFIYPLLFLFLIPTSHGQGWQWVNPLPQGNTLYDIHIFDANSAIVVGDAGTAMRTSDGGENWDIQHNVSGVFGELWGVDFNSATGVAVGRGGVIIRTTDGGNTWQKQVSVTYLDLYDVVLIDSMLGFAIGGHTGEGGIMLRTDDGGLSWISLEVPDDVAEFRKITFVNKNFGVAVGFDNFTYKTVDGGETWTHHIFLSDPNKSPLDVVFFDENLGIAVGKNGGIVRTEDGGDTWTQPERITSIDIHSVSFLDSLTVLAVSGGRTILSSDAGKTWGNETTLYNQGTFRAIRFANSTKGYIVGSSGLIFTTNNSGQNWTRYSNGITEDLRDVCFPDSEFGVAVGTDGTIIKTTDGGNSWLTLDGGGKNRFQAVSFIDRQTGATVGDNGAIIDVDGVILWTKSGGQVWLNIQSPTPEGLDDIYLFNDSTAVIIGNNNIYKTWNTGNSWMLTFEGISVHPEKVNFWNADTGMAVGGNGPTILTTTDGGVTWVKRETDVIWDLNDVIYRDYNSAVAVGNRGTILLTDDSGIFWRSVEPSFERGLTSVRFLNHLIGITVGSQGAMFKTIDGGETWVRQASAVGDFLTGAAITGKNSAVVVGVVGTILKTSQLHTVSVEYGSPPEGTLSLDFVLEQNYPNPFNPSTTISYEVQNKARFNLTVYDVRGRQVRELVDGFHAPGSYRTQWNGRDDIGWPAPTGVYFVRMSSNAQMQVIKLLYIN